LGINPNFLTSFFEDSFLSLIVAKYRSLGLIFIKYISETFNELYYKLESDEYSDPEDRDEYLAENIFFVPSNARWSHLHNNAKLSSIGEIIDEAMESIEKENKELKNADYLHNKGFFVGNSHVCLKKEIKFLKKII